MIKVIEKLAETGYAPLPILRMKMKINQIFCAMGVQGSTLLDLNPHKIVTLKLLF
ncbi:MAG: hypothetical protein FWE24_08675 [Defluviitaleaceae bacterium]|nr:hypothetical protein [Defluviitaleaceae bacterium]